MQKHNHLTLEDRAVIEAYYRLNLSVADIAKRLGKHRSTIYRELKRMGDPKAYRMHVAQRMYQTQRQRSAKPCKLTQSPKLFNTVKDWIHNRQWSPEQIAKKLRLDHPDDPTMQISHETIYRSIYSGVCGELKKTLIANLRQSKSKRGTRARASRANPLKIEPDQLIANRPPEIDTELLPGHWEGDLIVGAMNRSCVGTLVERRSGFVILAKMDSKSASDVRAGFEQKMADIDTFMRLSMTYDRGSEMAEHALMSKALDLKIYFADPHAPWQRGRNENINGLIRQYLPKGTDLSVHSQEQLDDIAWLLNTRPRKRHGFISPQDVYDQQLNDSLNSVAIGS